MQPLDSKRRNLSDVFDALAESAAPTLLVEQVMTARPTCTLPTTSAYEVVRIFHARQFRHLLVADEENCLIGVVSDRDVLRCFGPNGSPSKDDLESVTAESLMSTDVITIAPTAPLSAAVNVMLAHGINCLPVVAEGKLAGIITSTDLYLVLEGLLSRPLTAR